MEAPSRAPYDNARTKAVFPPLAWERVFSPQPKPPKENAAAVDKPLIQYVNRKAWFRHR